MGTAPTLRPRSCVQCILMSLRARPAHAPSAECAWRRSRRMTRSPKTSAPMRTDLQIATSLLSVVLAGCASTAPREGFDDVARLVSDRSTQRLHWNGGGEADEEVRRSVEEHLSSELTADVAAQIALLNNRGLQAVYEDLGIAQADVVRAGRLTNPVLDAEIRFPEGGGVAGLHLSIVEGFLDLLLLPLRRKSAAEGFESAKLRVARDVLQLAGEVRARFYSLQAAQQ